MSVFEIGGILHPDKNQNEYFRLDASQKDKYTDAHKWLGQSTAGDAFALHRRQSGCAEGGLPGCVLGMHHFATGVYGFDMHTGTGTDRRYAGKAMQTFAENPNENCQVLELYGSAVELMINFPLYGGIRSCRLACRPTALFQSLHRGNICPSPFTAPPSPREGAFQGRGICIPTCCAGRLTVTI